VLTGQSTTLPEGGAVGDTGGKGRRRFLASPDTKPEWVRRLTRARTSKMGRKRANEKTSTYFFDGVQKLGKQRQNSRRKEVGGVDPEYGDEAMARRGKGKGSNDLFQAQKMQTLQTWRVENYGGRKARRRPCTKSDVRRAEKEWAQSRSFAKGVTICTARATKESGERLEA